MNYYDRQGNPITMMEFARADWSTRRVAKTSLVVDGGTIEVSTVWLGLDHNFFGGGPPVIFESMILGGEHDEECWRYATEAAARAGHDRVVASLLAELPGAYVSPRRDR